LARLAHVGRRAAVGDEVVLEDLHLIEAGVGDGFELFAQGAAQGNRRNRGLHAGSPQAMASRRAEASANVRFMRATSASRPVKWRKASTAWCTHMPLPFMVRQPLRRAASTSSVLRGV